MLDVRGRDGPRELAQSIAELGTLHRLCREGRLYDVERWIAEGKPLQCTPAAVPKGTRPKMALQIALETGQHSLVALLLKNGYRLELERYAPLDLTLRSRRWDLFDLLLDCGADLKSVDVYSVLETYNVDLYERFWAAGYDLAERHEMGSILGHGTRNRPLLGFAKRHHAEDPKIQQELNIALVCHAKAGNERGVNLCLWAGADPHAPAPDLDVRVSRSSERETGGDEFIGWTAIEEAALAGHLGILKRLGPDPTRDDFDGLYQLARYESIITFLATIQAPTHLTRILGSQLCSLDRRFPYFGYRSTGVVEELLNGSVRWEESDAEQLGHLRRSLAKLGDEHLKTIVARLARPDICSPETYHELLRTPTMQRRLRALGLVKKPVTEREKLRQEHARRAHETARLLSRYDRAALYEQVWTQPVQKVAEGYGVSGVMLGKVCRALKVPVPPRGYWARVRSGGTVKRPALPKLGMSPDSS